RAVSAAAAAPYKEKLIELPAFLSTGGLPADGEELRKGLDLTGYFLERHVFWPHNKPLPAARARFMETLQR
ncbi:MAG TPA: DNA repair protein RecO C-terminal domain-containing protein, partial [Reyranella sp.]|nr:DNA repair protein RecO C-terminal domain-containing protein [Reyranella sp.]